MTKCDYFLARRQALSQIVFWTVEGKVVYREELRRGFSRLFPVERLDDVQSYRKQYEQFILGEVERRGLLLHEPTPCPRRRRRKSRKHAYINVYMADRVFGGVEEGGWWYDCGWVVESVKVSRKRLPQVLPRYEAWAAGENANRNSNVSSVASEGRYDVEVDDFPGEDWPRYRPTYC